MIVTDDTLATARRLPVRGLLLGLVGLVGLTNLIVLIAEAAPLVHSLYLNADNASALTLPALAGHAGHGAIVNLGNHAWYEPWLLMRATAGLPVHRQLWELMPFAYGLVGSAAVAACAAWVLGRTAGLISAVVLVSASEAQRGTLYVPESHVLVLIHTALLCASLLFISARAASGRLSLRTCLIVGVPLTLFTAVGLTDQLLLISGLAPFVLAPVLCLWRLGPKPWLRVLAFSLVVGAGAALLGLLITGQMRHSGVTSSRFPISFVTPEAIVTGLQNTIATVASIGGGDFFGIPARDEGLFTFLAGVLCLTAFAAILHSLSRQWSERDHEAGHDASQDAPSRELYVSFWGLALVLTLVVFSLTSVSANLSGGRYLLGAWAAAAALLGTLATGGRRWVVVVLAVAGFGLLNVRSELVKAIPPGGSAPGPRLAGAIDHFAIAHDASIGYTGYWDSAPVALETNFAIKLYPIETCTTSPQGLCSFYSINISSWYAPHPGTRSFLVTDARPNVPLAIVLPPPRLGRPIASANVGEGFAVYVYGYDIASRLGPSPSLDAYPT